MKRLLFISFSLLLIFSACSESGNLSSISEANQIIESLEKYPDKWHAKWHARTRSGTHFVIIGPKKVRLRYVKAQGASLATDVEREGITLVNPKPKIHFQDEDLLRLKKALEPFVQNAKEPMIQENQSKIYRKIF